MEPRCACRSLDPTCWSLSRLEPRCACCRLCSCIPSPLPSGRGGREGGGAAAAKGGKRGAAAAGALESLPQLPSIEFGGFDLAGAPSTGPSLYDKQVRQHGHIQYAHGCSRSLDLCRQWICCMRRCCYCPLCLRGAWPVQRSFLDLKTFTQTKPSIHPCLPGDHPNNHTCTWAAKSMPHAPSVRNPRQPDRHACDARKEYGESRIDGCPQPHCVCTGLHL